jgi:nucleoside phosphorylase
MIAAALEEELDIARTLCPDSTRVSADKIKIWQGVRNDRPLYFLKAGVGPRKSAAVLEEALKLVHPSRILLIGYAGALDPELKLGALIAIRKAYAFSLESVNPSWERIQIDGEFELTGWEELLHSAQAAGIDARAGETLTSSYVLGDPVHKRLLHDKFHAGIVDMETAALARIARSGDVPFSCIRVVSDEARDEFLAPFSYDPSAGISKRAVKLLDVGMLETYREWKRHTAAAKESLGLFLAQYL